MNTNEDALEGFYLINKPIGYSSFKCIYILRKKTNIKKIGHAGTLDPFASGLLIVAIGKKYTRQIDSMQGLEKTYTFTVKLGQSTDTLDCTADITSVSIQKPPIKVSQSDIEKTLEKFKGNITQIPPAFCAKKKDGKKSYVLARKGIKLDLAPINIEIKTLKLLKFTESDYPEFSLECTCSKGTYIRQLAFDIGKELGYPAHTIMLTRTQIGPYLLKNALDIELIKKESLEKEKLPL